MLVCVCLLLCICLSMFVVIVFVVVFAAVVTLCPQRLRPHYDLIPNTVQSCITSTQLLPFPPSLCPLTLPLSSLHPPLFSFSPPLPLSSPPPSPLFYPAFLTSSSPSSFISLLSTPSPPLLFSLPTLPLFPFRPTFSILPPTLFHIPLSFSISHSSSLLLHPPFYSIFVSLVGVVEASGAT